MDQNVKQPEPVAQHVQGMLHPVVHVLAHHLQAWQAQRQAEGQAMILARALVESGHVKGGEIHNGVVFIEGSCRVVSGLNAGMVQPGKDAVLTVGSFDLSNFK